MDKNFKIPYTVGKNDKWLAASKKSGVFMKREIKIKRIERIVKLA
jgi:hypothetical protein